LFRLVLTSRVTIVSMAVQNMAMYKIDRRRYLPALEKMEYGDLNLFISNKYYAWYKHFSC
jgi:hypothetical protein